MKKYVMEAIGSFFLVLTISLSSNPLSIGVVLMAMIYMGGYISGAHYNPVVTLAVYLQKKIDNQDASLYVVFQLLGAVLASLVFLFIKHHPLVSQPGKGYTFAVALLVEILFTFALCSVVLHTAVSKKNNPNQFFGLAIGATVMAGAFSVGTISGGAFNPAVGVGPIIANLPHAANISNLLLYTIGPGFGAVIASVMYSYTTSRN